MGEPKKHSPRRPVPQDKPTLASRLEAFRVEKNLTNKALAALIGSISGETIRRAQLGLHLSPRISARLDNFLTKMEGVNRAA